MHLDGVQSVEKLDLVKLENQLSQDLLPQEGGPLAAIEEDNPEQPVVLLT